MRVLATVGLLLVAVPATACPICMPLPRQTVADRLIGADVVAFGREDPSQPFSYAVTRVLKGQVADPHVELFADSTTRRQLVADEQRRVLLVKSEVGWQNLGVADEDYQQIVQRIVVFAPEWLGVNGPQKRLEYFVTLWNHENRAVFELAYLELGKAPYAAIRKFGAEIPVEELQPMLTRRDYFEWRSLAILMLAQRTDEVSQKLIAGTFENCARFSLTAHLAAWTTAYVEIHEIDGVDVIERAYLRNPKRTEEEIRSVLAALSLHGQLGDAGLRRRIVACYGSALEVHPRVADAIARDLTEWNEFSYIVEFKKIVKDSEPMFDKNGLLHLRNHIISADN